MDDPRDTRIYWRNGRAWADLRTYADVGGRRTPLAPPGQKIGTKDPDVAARLLAALIEQYERARRDRMLYGTTSTQELRAYANDVLSDRARMSSVTNATLAAEQYRLELACAVLYEIKQESQTLVHEITPKDAKTLISLLRRRKSAKGGTLSDATVRHVVDAMGRLYARAAEDGVVPPGYNPFRSLSDKPKRDTPEKDFLEIHEAGKLLEVIADECGWEHLKTAAIATFLLTGGRRMEVFGLEARDVDFEGRLVHFRPNRWRALKNKHSRRSVRLWPQLESILRGYLRENPRIGGLLFPSDSPQNEADGLITRWDRWLNRAVKKARLKKHVTLHTFRHTYTVARLMTIELIPETDLWAGVSTFSVAKELGHRSTKLVDEVYAHLPKTQVRSPVVEYRSAPTTSRVVAQSASQSQVQKSGK